MLLTTVIHAGGMMLVMNTVRYHFDQHKQVKRWRHSNMYLVSGTVLLMFFVSLLEVGIWAVAYMELGAIDEIEPAIYFSMVTFTTVGYGDIVIDDHWRLLASFEAANGIIMFGWTTAIVIAVVQRVYAVKKS